MTETTSQEYKTNKPQYYTIKGIALASIGVLLLLTNRIGTPTVFILTGLLHLIAGLCTYLFTNANKDNRVGSVWLMLEAIAEVVFGLASILIVKDMELYITLFAFWALLFSFLQIIFIFNLFNADERPNLAIVGMRAISGILCGIIALMLVSGYLKEGSIQLISAMALIAGFGIIISSLRFRSGS